MNNYGYEIINIDNKYIKPKGYFRKVKNIGDKVAKYIWKDMKKMKYNIQKCNNLQFTIKQYKGSHKRNFIIKVVEMSTKEINIKTKNLFNFIKNNKKEYSINKLPDDILFNKIENHLPKYNLIVKEKI